LERAPPEKFLARAYEEREEEGDPQRSGSGLQSVNGLDVARGESQETDRSEAPGEKKAVKNRGGAEAEGHFSNASAARILSDGGEETPVERYGQSAEKDDVEPHPPPEIERADGAETE
jgi:hypothetical protein